MALPERPRRFSGRYFHLYTRLIVHAPNGKTGTGYEGVCFIVDVDDDDNFGIRDG
jgi:hypothetical protein